MADDIAENHSITHLKFEENNIGDSKLAILAKSISGCNKMLDR
ncbi:hypothetical protein [Rickettsiales endosymbiont of Stachyamoeba lipophora]|nr:hypothetical protein [Rickettsiales endosymbiont of Stachyamoeba lipophora]